MKKKDVVIGQSYVCKVSDRLQTVRVVRESRYGGWDGINIATGRDVRILGAARLRYAVDHDCPEAEKEDSMNPVVIEKFETRSKKVEVNLVRWGSGEIGVQITDGSSNFTSFPVDDENEGRIRGEFLASRFRAVIA